MTLLLARTVLEPLELREVAAELLPLERLVRLWSTLPAERAVVPFCVPALRLVVTEEELLPLERLVVALLLPEERLVVPFWVAALRLVRSFWTAVPAEREAEEEVPELRLVVAEEELPLERLVVLLPEERLVVPFWLLELRLVRSFCAKAERVEDAPVEWLTEALAERPADAPEERLTEGVAEPDERLIEEDPRVVVWEEDDRAAEDPPERRDWASASGAAIITKVMRSAAKVLIILFMALSF